MEGSQIQRGLLTNSKTLRFYTELRAEIALGNIREDVARKAADIILGKTGLKPWSDIAIDQAKAHTWQEQYQYDTKYSAEGRKTPFEKFVEKMANA